MALTVVVGVIVGLGLSDARGSDIFAEAMGIVALVGTVVQWSPQIVTTFRAKTAGALSIPSLLIQAPGSGLFAYFQIFSTASHTALHTAARRTATLHAAAHRAGG